MNRYQNGPYAPLDPFTGHWKPAVGVLPPLLVMAVGLGCTVWLARWNRLAVDLAPAPGPRLAAAAG